MQSTCTIPLRKKVKDNEDSRFSSFACTFSSSYRLLICWLIQHTPQSLSHALRCLHQNRTTDRTQPSVNLSERRCLLKLSPKLWCRAGSSAVHKMEELLNTVLLGSALRISSGGDALGALVVVVLGSSALLGLDALCL